jgi:hypothetical protein
MLRYGMAQKEEGQRCAEGFQADCCLLLAGAG